MSLCFFYFFRTFDLCSKQTARVVVYVEVNVVYLAHQ